MDEAGVVLGEYVDAEGGVAFLSDDDRRRHVYVLGKSGVGKSSLSETMILSDLRRGRGFALIDPMGDLAERIADRIPLSRQNNVIYIDPTDATHSLGFNLLHNVPPDSRPLVASQIVEAFSALWDLSLSDTPRLLYILYNSLRLLLDTPGSTLLGIQKLLTNERYRGKLLRACKDPAVRNAFEEELLRLPERELATALSSVQNKLGMLLGGPLRNILGSPRSTIDVGRIMNEGYGIILNAAKGKIGPLPTHILGSLFTIAFAQAAERRAVISEDRRRDFTLYCEELQNYTTDALLSIITESRKWRLSTVLSHQTLVQLPAQLSRTIVGTVGSLIAFRLGGEDADTLAKDLKNTEHIFDQSRVAYIDVAEPIVLTDTGNFFAWMKLLENGMPTKTRLVETELPRPEIEGQFEAVRRHSRARYLRPRAIVEERIERFLSSSRARAPRRRRKTHCTRHDAPQ